MIKTQLCPASELENRHWWVTDVVVIAMVAAAAHFGVEGYLNSKRFDIQRLISKKAQWDQEYATKESSIAKFKTLNMEMRLLNNKIGALQKITTSKVDKVRPIVALDQLQTLWMDGIWYEGLEYLRDGTVTIHGAAFDSLIIGEYMLGIVETMSPTTGNDDVRTRLGFDHVTLKAVKSSDSKDEIFPDVVTKLQFEISGNHVEKTLKPRSITGV